MIKPHIKILLIEDNPGDVRLIREMLAEAKDAEFIFQWTNQLSDALGLLSKESFDVVLLDLFLTDSIGIETFTALHKENPQIPVIILTGLDDESIALKAVREGAQDYLTKGNLGSSLLTRSLKYSIERSKIERAFRDSEMQYRSTLNSMGDAIHVVDKDLKFILFNQTFKQWNMRLGLTTDVIGKTLFNVFPFLTDKVLKEYQLVIETGKTLVTQENQTIGEEVFITETRKIPVFEGDKVIRIVTVIRDITKQKKDEEALRYSEEKYSNLFQHSNDKIIMHDLEGNIIDANQKALNDFGYTMPEILSVKVSELYPAEAQRLSQNAFERIRKDGFIRIEINFKKKDGEIFPAEVSSSLFYIGGKPVIQKIIRDISERKMAELALQDSEAKFRALSENSPNMIFINKNSKIVYANKRCEEIMEYKKEEFYSPDFDFLTLIAPEFQKNIIENFNRHLQNKDVPSFEFINVTKSGKKIESMLTTKLIDYEGDKAILGIITDITKLKEAERVLQRDKETFERLVNEKTEELLSTQKKLSDAKRLSDIGLLGATVAHELRNPLTVIGTSIYNIKHKRQNPSIDTHLKKIEKQISESNQIINNLLFYSRIKMPSFDYIDIISLLEECIGDIFERSKDKKITIHKHWKGREKCLVEADSLQLKEVFINILINACDAIKNQKGKIDVGIGCKSNEYVKIFIKDNGSGIDEKVLNKVYEPFFSTKSKGTGLGLTICSQIVSLHYGYIDIETEKNQGTTVTLTLPIKNELK